MRLEGRYAGAARWLLGLLAALSVAGRAHAEGLIDGLESWSRAVTGRAGQRWVGQRVLPPEPTPRPPEVARLDSETWPISVHLDQPGEPARALAAEILKHAEDALALLQQAGLFEDHGDAGQGGTAQRDLYLVDAPVTGAYVDASLPVQALDGAYAFALLDVRTPKEQRAACTTEALVEAELFELDPAESEAVRKASAAYFAKLVTGQPCGAWPAPRARSSDVREVLFRPDLLLGWLEALSARMDQNRGTFLASMWQFARQQTWEGVGLRGSPDLLEAIAKAYALTHHRLEDVAGELAPRAFLPEGVARAPGAEAALRFDALPAHQAASAPLGPLDSHFQLLDLGGPKPGRRLSVWSRGEYGVRWALSASRLDADGHLLSTVSAPVRKNPDAELQVELDAETRFIWISVTNLVQGVPDPDAPPDAFERSVRLIIDADAG